MFLEKKRRQQKSRKLHTKLEIKKKWQKHSDQDSNLWKNEKS